MKEVLSERVLNTQIKMHVLIYDHIFYICYELISIKLNALIHVAHFILMINILGHSDLSRGFILSDLSLVYTFLRCNIE